MASIPFDNLVLQPYPVFDSSPNRGCSPYGANGDGQFINDFYQLAKATNPQVQLWVYETWPPGLATNWASIDCFVIGGGGDPKWTPPVSASDWKTAMQDHIAYDEAVRAAIDQMNPGAPKRPLIVPAGYALVQLRNAVESGMVHGVAATAFTSTFYESGAVPLHLVNVGSAFLSFVFHSVLFHKSPAGIPLAVVPAIGADELADLQNIAWQATLAYPYSGLTPLP